MKKTIAMSLAAVMSAAALAGCSGGSSAPAATAAAETSAEANGAAGVKDTPGNARVVKFGNSGAIGEPAPQTCQEFCDIVNAKIGDRYYFEFYPAEQLGNETTMLENIQVGLQEGMMCALDTLATYESDLNILSMAFAFDSYDNMIDYLKSDVAAPIWETLDGQGIHVINFEFQKNPRIFFANKELKSPADMVGMKYRIPNLPIFEKNARAMGATPVVVAWSEYPFALMQGVVDGGECSKDSYRSAGLYESAKFVADVDYAYPVEQICFSTQFWDSLSPEDQKIIEDAAAEVASHHSERTLDQWNKDKEWLISEGGVTFCDIDRQAFINAAAPLGAELQSEGFFTTPDLYDQTRQFNQ
ncbi:TRAP transporter substrate-binding protein [Otoolea muris]|uniref:TRAP transporter substrate-binding protein n=1 Tax=Otoolea muris TaxID=2941515 RepID=UPI00203F44B8|nr:TRAP transporter substrate-binding protein [Otoolea muris]